MGDLVTLPSALIGTAQPPPTAQPSPQVIVDITPQGMLLTVLLGPGMSLNQAISSEGMQQIAERWIATCSIEQSMELVRAIRARHQTNRE
jgi:hypothetical protein